MLVTIGRDENCNFVMGSPRISGVHCQIRFFADRFEVTDLGSSNGTFVGWQRTRVQGSTIVFPGQPLYLGSIEVSPRDVAAHVGLKWPDVHSGAPSPKQVVGSGPTLLEGPKHVYADFWKRVGASILDGLLVSVLNFAIAGRPPQVTGLQSQREILRHLFAAENLQVMFASMLLGWLYYAILESSPQQATLGKMALGLRVTDSNGNRVSFAMASGRHFGKLVSSIVCGAGYLMAAFTEKKQTLHDMMASTLVLEKR